MSSEVRKQEAAKWLDKARRDLRVAKLAGLPINMTWLILLVSCRLVSNNYLINSTWTGLPIGLPRDVTWGCTTSYLWRG